MLTCARVSFKLKLYWKKRLWHRGFPVNFARFFRTNFLRNTPGWLLLYFAIMYSWQLSSNEKSLAWKKFVHIFHRFYRFRFLLHIYFFSFSLTNTFLPCWLRKAYAVIWASNRCVGSETPKHNAFDHFKKYKFRTFSKKHTIH